MLALVLGFLIGPDPRATIPKWTDFARVGYDVAWGVGLGLVIYLGIHVLDWIPSEKMREFRSETNDLLRRMVKKFDWKEMVALCIAAGVGEELLFRGWLQQGIGKWISGLHLGSLEPVLAIGVASLLFGAVHYLNRIYFIIATIYGIIFGVAYYATNEILIPIVAHALYDLLIMVSLRYGERDR